MEVMSGVIPFDFRREEIAIRDIGKIYSYSAKIPIKNQLDKWRRKETTDRHISPLGLMCLQGEEIKKETKIDVQNIEEEFQFGECYCCIFSCFSALLKYQISTFDFLFLCSSF
jgi:hypothetical protein